LRNLKIYKNKRRYTMASANVEKVKKTVKENPDLLKGLNNALVEIFAASNVDLTIEEKREFLHEFANAISGEGKKVAGSFEWS
jgi:hypothetical protein